MKTKLIYTVLLALFFTGRIFAQDVTTVRANSTDISDNLDLQAVASIFGQSRDLEDFERRLNDPDARISNLDLNNDGRVDYLRVSELTQNNTHVIVLQAVLGVDTYQDVATIDVDRDTNNNVNVSVVGDVYMYGPNYVYQPVYAVRPPLFGIFWASSYRPYYSPWYWNYYPTYYSYWAPYSPYRYHNHVSVYINTRNNYVYVNNYRNTRASALYNTRRANAYEVQHPNRSFTNRNTGLTNRHQLDQNRGNLAVTRNTTRGNANSFSNSSSRNVNVNGAANTARSNSFTTSRNTTTTRTTDNNIRSNNSGALYTGGRNTSNDMVRSAGNSSQVVRSNGNVPAVSSSNNSFNNGRNNGLTNTAAPSQSFNNNSSSFTRGNSSPTFNQPARAMQAAPNMTRSSAPVMSSPSRQSAPSAPSMSRGGGSMGAGNGGGAGSGHTGGRRG